MKSRFLTIALLLISSASVWAGMTRDEAIDTLSQARQLFQQAMDKESTDPKAAEAAFRGSLLRYLSLVEEGDIENGKLYYNIGNIYYRLKDLGRAILYYRKAERLISRDLNLQKNLAYALSRRADHVEIPADQRVLGVLLFWHYDLAFGTRLTVACFCFICFWAGCMLRLRQKRWAPRAGLAVFALVWALLAGSLLWETRTDRTRQSGVVLAPSILARKGNGEGYEPAFEAPLHAGTEFVLLEDRGQWVQVLLQDGRSCWVPRKHVAMVSE